MSKVGAASARFAVVAEPRVRDLPAPVQGCAPEDGWTEMVLSLLFAFPSFPACVLPLDLRPASGRFVPRGAIEVKT